MSSPTDSPSPNAVKLVMRFVLLATLATLPRAAGSSVPLLSSSHAPLLAHRLSTLSSWNATDVTHTVGGCTTGFMLGRLLGAAIGYGHVLAPLALRVALVAGVVRLLEDAGILDIRWDRLRSMLHDGGASLLSSPIVVRLTTWLDAGGGRRAKLRKTALRLAAEPYTAASAGAGFAFGMTAALLPVRQQLVDSEPRLSRRPSALGRVLRFARLVRGAAREAFGGD